jgi:hypothetical protein
MSSNSIVYPLCLAVNIIKFLRDSLHRLKLRHSHVAHVNFANFPSSSGFSFALPAAASSDRPSSCFLSIFDEVRASAYFNEFRLVFLVFSMRRPALHLADCGALAPPIPAAMAGSPDPSPNSALIHARPYADRR